MQSSGRSIILSETPPPKPLDLDLAGVRAHQTRAGQHSPTRRPPRRCHGHRQHLLNIHRTPCCVQLTEMSMVKFGEVQMIRRQWNNLLRNAVFRFARAAGLSPELERPDILVGALPEEEAKSQRRPADVYLPGWTRGIPAALA